MATTDQLVSWIKRRLSRRNDASIDTIIIDELGFAQEELESKPGLPLFLQHWKDTLIAANTGEIPVSSLKETTGRFIRPVNDGPLSILDTTVVTGDPYKLIRRYPSLEALLTDKTGTTEGFPEGYVIDNKTATGFVIVVRPIPTVDQTYRFRYYRGEATAPAVGNSTLWTTNAGPLLLAETGFNVAQFLRDQAALQFFAQKRAEARRDFINGVTAMEMADFDNSMGDD